mmetsp:Transcript_17205/g.27634  ORF Transcript_17205/g.27634 Transcript_17205/m.27634 type:complete len:510 (-) Transcript_17205:40-1569(-)
MSVAALPGVSPLCRSSGAGNKTPGQKRWSASSSSNGARTLTTPAPPAPSLAAVPKRACCARRRGTVTAAHVGDAQWFVQQGVAAGVILGGFVASGVFGGMSEGNQGNEGDGMEDPNETCPMCEGTGKTECACVRWSGDGEGCSSCGYTGIRNCPACRGGGKAVRVTVEIPVEADDVSVRQSDRSGFAMPGAAAAAAASETYAFAALLAMPRPAGVERDSSHSIHSPSSSSSPSSLRFRFPPSFDDDEDDNAAGSRELNQEALMYLLGQMPLISGGRRMSLSSSFVHVEHTEAEESRADGVGRSADLIEPDVHMPSHAVIVAEPSSSGGGGAGGPGPDGSNDNETPTGTDPSSSKDDDFYAQSGEAVRTLRDDYPSILTKPLTLGIYRDDIGLVDDTASMGHNEGHVLASGLAEYKRSHRWLRTGAHVLFARSEVQVQRIWSPLGSSGMRTIKVRWSVKGRLRLVGQLTEEVHFDGISEYLLDRRGFIYQHTLTDLDWDMAQFRYRLLTS